MTKVFNKEKRALLFTQFNLNFYQIHQRFKISMFRLKIQTNKKKRESNH